MSSSPHPGHQTGPSPWWATGPVTCSARTSGILAEYARFGAVSAEVAVALAEGVRARFGAELGVGITGVAGPGGGTPEKPVGTVHLCVAGPDGREARALQLPGSRTAVRERSVTMAMHLLRELLLGGPPA